MGDQPCCGLNPPHTKLPFCEPSSRTTRDSSLETVGPPEKEAWVSVRSDGGEAVVRLDRRSDPIRRRRWSVTIVDPIRSDGGGGLSRSSIQSDPTAAVVRLDRRSDPTAAAVVRLDRRSDLTVAVRRGRCRSAAPAAGAPCRRSENQDPEKRRALKPPRRRPKPGGEMPAIRGTPAAVEMAEPVVWGTPAVVVMSESVVRGTPASVVMSEIWGTPRRPALVRRFAGEALDPPPAPGQGARSRPGQGLTRNSETRLEPAVSHAEAVLELFSCAVANALVVTLVLGG
eukprot:1177890-Prorocentrum_minimum.AAC.1